MLSYPSLTEPEELKIRQFLQRISVIELDETLKNSAIEIRRKYRLKLMDAIICATALSLNSVLLSNDTQLSRVKEITIDAVQIR